MSGNNWAEMWQRAIDKADRDRVIMPDWARSISLKKAFVFEHIDFVYEAKQEMLRLIVDVQQNRNRPEDLP